MCLQESTNEVEASFEVRGMNALKVRDGFGRMVFRQQDKT